MCASVAVSTPLHTYASPESVCANMWNTSSLSFRQKEHHRTLSSDDGGGTGDNHHCLCRFLGYCSSNHNPPSSHLPTQNLKMKITETLFALTTMMMSTSVVRGFTSVSRSALSVATRSALPTAGRISTPAAPRSLGIRMMSSSPMDFAKAEIANNKVVVFSKSFCPFCKKTKSLLNEKGVDFALYELNEMDNGGDIQDALLEISGQKTVPNVFINGVHLGGNSETQEANASGKLDEMLAS